MEKGAPFIKKKTSLCADLYHQSLEHKVPLDGEERSEKRDKGLNVGQNANEQEANNEMKRVRNNGAWKKIIKSKEVKNEERNEKS